VKSGGWIDVVIPRGLSPECHGDNFVAIALPSAGGCTILDEANLRIPLNSTIGPGEYVFAFFITPPIVEPVPNLASIFLKNQNGGIEDAAVMLPAMPIREKLRIQSMPLLWTASRGGRSSIITLGFSCMDTLPDDIVAPEQQVADILLALPVGFTHLVERMEDFTLVNEDMPLDTNGGWLDYMQKDRLRVTLHLNQSSWLTLKAGDYSFKFPVLVPERPPVFNVWQVALCRPSYGGCNRMTDPAVVVRFAYPGFELGQASPDADNAAILASGSVRISRADGALIALAVVAMQLVRHRGMRPAPWLG